MKFKVILSVVFAINVINGERCGLEPAPGPCRMRKPRYYFDSQRSRCQVFFYGGCGGNDNNFESLSECVAECKPQSRLREHIKADFCLGPPVENGINRCRASFPKVKRKFYFSSNP